MAYMNQEMKQVIAANLKPVLSKYKIKGTLSIRDYSSIILTLQSGAVNFRRDYIKDKKNEDSIFYHKAPSFDDLGEMWHSRHEDFTGASREFLKQAREALESAGWYDKTHSEIDVFDTAYYVIIRLKPYGKDYKYIGD